MGTFVVGVIVAALVACAARSIYKDRKAGKCRLQWELPFLPGKENKK